MSMWSDFAETTKTAQTLTGAARDQYMIDRGYRVLPSGGYSKTTGIPLPGPLVVASIIAPLIVADLAGAANKSGLPNPKPIKDPGVNLGPFLGGDVAVSVPTSGSGLYGPPGPVSGQAGTGIVVGIALVLLLFARR